MWRWRRVAVARVFALVVRCRIMMVITLFSRWQKPWHQWGSPAGAGAACAANHITILLCQKILAAQKPMTYTDLLCAGFIYSILSSCSLGWHFVILLWAVFNHALNHGKICIRILTNLLAHVRCYILHIFYGGLQLHESRNKHTSNCLALIQHISFSSKHPISGIHFCNNLAVVSYFSRIPSVLPMLILW